MTKKMIATPMRVMMAINTTICSSTRERETTNRMAAKLSSLTGERTVMASTFSLLMTPRNCPRMSEETMASSKSGIYIFSVDSKPLEVMMTLPLMSTAINSILSFSPNCSTIRRTSVEKVTELSSE